MDIENFLIKSNISIYDAINIINKNGHGIAYICKGRKLKAVLSDGDIRRFILKNGDIKLGLNKVANYNPRFIKYGDLIDADAFMREKKITSVPILDNDQNIISIKFLNKSDVYRKINLDIPVVIMAGGKGTRLHPYTQILPKPLIPINDKTITELIMDKFEAFGCKKFNMIVNYKKNLIKAFFMDSELNHNVEFTDEHEFMGTGGGLKFLTGKYDSTFFMTNCDVLIDEDYGEILNYHKGKKNIITMICAIKNITIPYGTVTISSEGQALQLKEKPNFSFMTNTGVYVIEPAFLEHIPEQTYIDITDVIQNCIDKGKSVGIYPISENAWMDMGQISELVKMMSKVGINKGYGY